MNKDLLGTADPGTTGQLGGQSEETHTRKPLRDSLGHEFQYDVFPMTEQNDEEYQKEYDEIFLQSVQGQLQPNSTRNSSDESAGHLKSILIKSLKSRSLPVQKKIGQQIEEPKRLVSIRTEYNEVKYIEPRSDDIYGFHADEDFDYYYDDDDTNHDDEEASSSEEETLYSKISNFPELTSVLHRDTLPSLLSEALQGKNPPALISNYTDKIDEFYCSLFVEEDALDENCLTTKLDASQTSVDILERKISQLIIEQTKMHYEILKLQRQVALEKRDFKEAVKEEPTLSLETTPFSSVAMPYFLVREILHIKRDIKISLKEAKVKKYYMKVQEELDFWRNKFLDLDEAVNDT